MNPFDDLGEHTHDLLDLAGRDDGIVYNYEPAAEGPDDEWYNDTVESDWTEDDGTEISLMIDFQGGLSYGGQSTNQGVAGTDRQGNVTITVDPNEAEFSDGTGPEARASEVLDTRDGIRYRVEQVIDDHGGVLTLDASRMDPTA